MNKEWKEMQHIWEQANPGGPDADGILSYVVTRAEKFDRRIRWEHRLGWSAAAVGLACVVELMSRVEGSVEVAFGLSMAAFLVGLTVHLWLKGRSKEPVDRSLSRPYFRATLEKKFNTQIRLLRATKYWFVLPLIATGCTTVWAYLTGHAEENDWLFFPVMLLGTAFAWWFNEACAVKGMRKDWEELRRALDDGELP